MDFTIYTLGDASSFQAALTAVSMLFNPSNTEGWVSNGSQLGLGYMAALAMMIGLTFMLFRGAMSLRFELGQLIVGAIIYAIMFVPKMSVNIEDYYTGVVTRVDNVPLGIALPGSVISTMTHEISLQFNVAFSTVNANYVSVSTNGYLTPLKILNQLRYGAKSIAELDPFVASSIKNLLIDCYAGRPEFNTNTVKNGAGPMAYIINTINANSSTITGITEYYSPASPAGVNKTCQDAATLIQSDLDTIYGGTDIAASTNNPSGLSKFGRMISTRVIGGSAGSNGGYSTGDYEQAFQSLTQLSGAQAKDFAITSLVSGLISMAPTCANSAASGADLARCMPLVQAMNTYQEDATASGTMFQRTMLHSMSIMLFLFYCFAPIVALMILALGQQGLKVLGGYMIFGVWTQSWLPVATIINYFIQQKVATEFLKLGPDASKLMTISNSPAIFDMLSTNVAIASDLMAATPILSLALLTGSFFALTGVASRVSGKDSYDEKINTTPYVNNLPVATNSSAYAGAMGLMEAAQGLASGPSYSRAATASSIRSLASGYERSASEAQHAGISNTYDALFSSTNSASEAWNLANSTGSTRSSDFRQAFTDRYGVAALDSLTYNAGQSTGARVRDVATKSDATTANVGLSASTSMLPLGRAAAAAGAVAGAVAKTAEIIPGMSGGVSASKTEADTQAAEQSVDRSASTAAGGSNSATSSVGAEGGRVANAQFTQRDEYQAAKRLAQQLDSRLSESQRQDLSKAFDTADKFSERAQQLDQSATQIGSSGSFGAVEIANAMYKNPSVADAIDQQTADARNMMSDTDRQAFNESIDRQYRAQSNTQVANMDSGTRTRLAELSALEEFDKARFGAAMSTLTGDTATFGNVGSSLVVADALLDKGQGLNTRAHQATAGTEDLDTSGLKNAGKVQDHVQSGIKKLEPLENKGAQSAAIRKDFVHESKGVVAEGGKNMQLLDKHRGDPSYLTQREAINNGVAALLPFVSPETGARLSAAASAINKYGDERGNTETARFINSDTDRNTRNQQSMLASNALRDAYVEAQARIPANQSGEIKQVYTQAQQGAVHYRTQNELLFNQDGSKTPHPREVHVSNKTPWDKK